MLVVSELVTNSVRHGPPREHIELLARRSEQTLEVEVCDPGPGFELPASVERPRTLEGGGLGLVIVDALADEWGMRRDGDACVWARFELAVN